MAGPVVRALDRAGSLLRLGLRRGPEELLFGKGPFAVGDHG
jgi:hypothetical protein